MEELILDGTKIECYPERIEAWAEGKRIAPVTVDMALTRACNYRCVYCYGQLQENKRYRITDKVISDFLEDAKDIGVKGVSLVSDGESTLSKSFVHTVQTGAELGLAMAVGTNGYALDMYTLIAVLPALSYLRFNISAGEELRYNEIMWPPKGGYRKVIQNVKQAVALKKAFGLKCTIGMQMVLMPEFADQILPLSRLAVKLGVDYLIIKHCSDNENSKLGVKYEKYQRLYPILRRAVQLSTSDTRVSVKWSKLQAGNRRSYQRCYGPPFIIQISGSGLVAPCGMFFNDRYKEYHIGNITRQRFRDIWKSDRYWQVMNYLASKEFDAQKMCGCLCLQHSVCEFLDKYKKGTVEVRVPENINTIAHKEFI